MKRERNDQVTELLAKFQFLEFSIKYQLSNAILATKSLIGGRIPFNFEPKDYEDSSLERLISLYQKFSSNKILIKKLNEIKKSRNKLAHNGFVITDHFLREYFSSECENMVNKFDLISNDLEFCFMELERDGQMFSQINTQACISAQL